MHEPRREYCAGFTDEQKTLFLKLIKQPDDVKTRIMRNIIKQHYRRNMSKALSNAYSYLAYDFGDNIQAIKLLYFIKTYHGLAGLGDYIENAGHIDLFTFLAERDIAKYDYTTPTNTVIATVLDNYPLAQEEYELLDYYRY